MVMEFDSHDVGDEDSAKATPKSANVGGVTFYRSKNGNLYRSGIVKAHRYATTVLGRRLSERLIFSNTNNICLGGERWLRESTSHARHSPRLVALFSKSLSTDNPLRVLRVRSRDPADLCTGTCLKGPKCRYNHEPSKVAICKEFLQKGSCPDGEACDLSHDLTPERTPTCLHFAKGNCSNPNCRYTHVRVSPTALVCRSFGIYGYCEKAINCTDRHVHECPDFSNTGKCTTKGCKLLHRYKASVIRKNTASGEQQGDGESSDLSSEEDQDEINSDDIDSDELDEEYFGQEDTEKDADIPMQQDFVQL
jgi:hypothetical protein